MLLAVLALAQAAPTDTLRLHALTAAPAFDGVASEAEYGAPALRLATAQGEARIWLARHGAHVYIAAELPDSTFHWGDDLVVSLDPMGDRTPAPGHDDTQWCLRRVMDSSVVYRGAHGRWMAPGDDPDWRVGGAREGDGWDVRSVSTARGWSVELRLVREWFEDEGGPRTPAIAFRTYDDAPHGWRAWPLAPDVRQPTAVERDPRRWAAVRVR